MCVTLDATCLSPYKWKISLPDSCTWWASYVIQSQRAFQETPCGPLPVHQVRTLEAMGPLASRKGRGRHMPPQQPAPPRPARSYGGGKWAVILPATRKVKGQVKTTCFFDVRPGHPSSAGGVSLGCQQRSCIPPLWEQITVFFQLCLKLDSSITSLEIHGRFTYEAVIRELDRSQLMCRLIFWWINSV